jgi:hypothetical protein
VAAFRWIYFLLSHFYIDKFSTAMVE